MSPGERLNKVAGPLGVIFYGSMQSPNTFNTLVDTAVAFDVIELASMQDDRKLKQWVINRIVLKLKEKIAYYESLR